MPEITSEPKDPLPSNKSSFDKRVEEFHRLFGEKKVTPKFYGPNDVLPIPPSPDARDPFEWLAKNVKGRGNERLYTLMWAAYRLIGTLPSEDEVKFRDLDELTPEREQELLASLTPAERKVLDAYHHYIVQVTASTEPITLPKPEVVVPPVAPSRSRREVLADAIIEHLDILAARDGVTDTPGNTKPIDTL